MPKLSSFEEMHARLMERCWQHFSASDGGEEAFAASLKRAASEIEHEITVYWAQATATMLKDQGIKPQ